jgi:integral membrane protein
MNFKSALGVLRILALVEGISYLLFALTMPLKYVYEMPMPNKIVGMAHGFLFIAYCIMVFVVNLERKWSFITNILAYLASLIPFGTFVMDAKFFKKEQLKPE